MMKRTWSFLSDKLGGALLSCLAINKNRFNRTKQSPRSHSARCSPDLLRLLAFLSIMELYELIGLHASPLTWLGGLNGSHSPCQQTQQRGRCGRGAHGDNERWPESRCRCSGDQRVLLQTRQKDQSVLTEKKTMMCRRAWRWEERHYLAARGLIFVFLSISVFQTHITKKGHFCLFILPSTSLLRI